MPKPQKNDDTKTKLGDIYHYYIVLKNCLELQEKETLYIEKYGDISLESKLDSKNWEIKHHTTKHQLIDRNIDFWKTLRNWIKYYENMKQFKKLILFTTSEYPLQGSFQNWNNMKGSEKIEALIKIGSIKKDAEETFRPLYNEIFKNEYEVIFEIIEKTELHLNQVDVSQIEKELVKNSFFKNVRKEDRHHFITYLMGHILTIPAHDSAAWSITCEEFESISCELRDRFKTDSKPLALPRDIPESPENIQEYHGKNFVKEIKEIQYLTKISSAISNYYRAQETIIHMSVDNPIFSLDLGDFQEDLKDSLSEYKSSLLDECDTNDSTDIITKSKRHYDKAMEHPVSNFGTINPNRPYFQKGIIHKIVEERGYTWKITK
ncbi:ABC-three component system protein [Paenibacillus sp. FSL M7-0896]|uniref:ABC-three component system protein n=1 Tax=Paenibacillus sp. FSL M7-0896 TaxID=2921610 RepID=UPI0030DDA264